MPGNTETVSEAASPDLSVVVPIYNEELILPQFLKRLRAALDGLAQRYEVIAVDDGSSDSTAGILLLCARSWGELRIVRLRANAGHQAALSAGLSCAEGRWTVSLDADLQDPPELIPEMLAIALDEDVEVVYGVRGDRSSDTYFKRQTARIFYRLLRRLSHIDLPLDAGDYRLMSRLTVDAVLSTSEHGRVLRIVVPALGFPSAEVSYRRGARDAGASKYTLSRMWHLAMDSAIVYSLVPLRVATWCGALGFAAALLLSVFAAISHAVGNTVSGWASTIAVICAFGGVQLMCIGILGEYVGRLLKIQQSVPASVIAYDSGKSHTTGWQVLPIGRDGMVSYEDQ
ncbi:glycosyltransferase family 2 protein [Nocardia sp. NPDC005978]|uniref:glycosyltransferase family 2 protein n=1 Tax=Nocardia sp. NPDC005978 TaxID=3156725 RepID=UPI0033B9238D